MNQLRELPPNTLLDDGGHNNPEDGLCLLEAVAYVAGEEHTDHPKCVSPVLGTIGRRLNDANWSSEIARTYVLTPLIPLLIGTAATGDENIRGAQFRSWVLRTFGKQVLEKGGFLTLARSQDDNILTTTATWTDEAALVCRLRGLLSDFGTKTVGHALAASSFFYHLADAYASPGGRPATRVTDACRAFEVVSDGCEIDDNSVLLLVAEKLKSMCLSTVGTP